MSTRLFYFVTSLELSAITAGKIPGGIASSGMSITTSGQHRPNCSDHAKFKTDGTSKVLALSTLRCQERILWLAGRDRLRYKLRGPSGQAISPLLSGAKPTFKPIFIAESRRRMS
jgi:hypothetical protein